MKSVMLALYVATIPTYATASTVTGVAKIHATGKPGFVQVNADGCVLTGTVAQKDGKATGAFTVQLKTCKDTTFAKRGEHTQAYLETDKFPEAQLTFKDWTVTASASEFTGELTVHGVTKPVKGTAAVSGDGKMIGELKLDVTQYGLAPASNLGTTVDKEVTVTVQGDVK